MMCVFPQIPHNLLIEDYFSGRRKARYYDLNGEHQFEKKLQRVRHMQQFVTDFRKEYKGKRGGNFCPVKLNNALHKILMEKFGEDRFTGWWIYKDVAEKADI